MAFFSTLISTVLKMLFIGVFAVGGVFAGKKLRERKDLSLIHISEPTRP